MVAYPIRTLNVFLWMAIIGFFLVLMVQGEQILVPLLFAILIWHLINALASFYQRLSPSKHPIPGWLGLSLATLTILLCFWVVWQIIIENMAAVIGTLPHYEANFERSLARISAFLDLKKTPTLDQIIGEIDFLSILSRLAQNFAGWTGTAVVIFLYLLFLLLEQRFFDRKLRVIFSDATHEKRIRDVLARIRVETQRYLWVKTVISLVVGLASYLLLRLVHVDYAEFWAFLVFFLKYIPVLGAFIATLLPASLALIQFETLYPFFLVLGGLGILQFIIGNFVEPRMLGNSLNLSPFAVMVSLMTWWYIWGVAGMFLCVPILVTLVILFAHFPKTKPLAILLTSRGQIDRFLKQ
ncbi:MAG: AI-2E family transporter [Alphaproteobacteria bacterium]|nr:AI-2E family transporter [Alphaproteobacteria bacterium]